MNPWSSRVTVNSKRKLLEERKAVQTENSIEYKCIAILVSFHACYDFLLNPSNLLANSLRSSFSWYCFIFIISGEASISMIFRLFRCSFPLDWLVDNFQFSFVLTLADLMLFMSNIKSFFTLGRRRFFKENLCFK